LLILEDTKELSKRLTMSGSNVEGIDFWGKDIKNIVVGKLEK
jgi:phenylalanyl-tRNA synthetase beta chain